MGKLKYLVIHCTATPEGREVSADDIRRMHTSPITQGGRGWRQVGYERVYHLDGKVSQMVDNNGDDFITSDEITNGAKGVNSVSRHWVYVGGLDSNMLPKDTRNKHQLFALRRDLIDFKIDNPDVIITGHYTFSNKACPCFNVEDYLKEIGIYG